jgi:hypothetical protein
MRQAGITVGQYYLGYAIGELETRFGAGCVKKNPAVFAPLIAGMVQAMAADFQATFLADQLGESLDGISAALGDKLGDIADALSSVQTCATELGTMAQALADFYACYQPRPIP